MTLYIFESSAYKYISEPGSSAAESSGSLFIYTKNNNSPNMVPCGIPLRTLNQDDCSPIRTTHCFLLHKKSVIHAIKSVFILYVFNFNSSLW